MPCDGAVWRLIPLDISAIRDCHHILERCADLCIYSKGIFRWAIRHSLPYLIFLASGILQEVIWPLCLVWHGHRCIQSIRLSTERTWVMDIFSQSFGL